MKLKKDENIDAEVKLLRELKHSDINIVQLHGVFLKDLDYNIIISCWIHDVSILEYVCGNAILFPI